MQIDKRDIEKLSELDDAVLREKLGAIFDEFGMEPKRKDKILSDIPNLKKQASSLSDRDIAKYSELLSKQDGGELIRRIKKETGGTGNG